MIKNIVTLRSSKTWIMFYSLMPALDRVKQLASTYLRRLLQLAIDMPQDGLRNTAW
jgi:hypothetical protein